jgi:hypothetical protein
MDAKYYCFCSTPRGLEAPLAREIPSSAFIHPSLAWQG